MIELAVSDAGDINNDGFDDVIVGASYINSDAGDAYVIFGRDDGYTEVDLTNIGYSGFRISGVHSYDQLGVSLSAAGDVNGDHFADFIIGAEREDSGGTDAGAAYVIFGHDGPFGTIDLATLTPTLGFMIQGSDAMDIAGRSVSGAGDFNGDGYSDLIVGAPFGDNGGAESGEAYVIFGRAGNFPSVIDLSNLGSAGFAIQGEFESHTGHRVSAAGDVNGDGYDDVIISGESSDKIYLIFGHGGPFGTIDLANLQPSAGMVFQAPTNDDYWEVWSVSGGGDINDDGVADILIGAPRNDQTGADAGITYVIYGHATSTPDVGSDFNGDGRSDILWRNDTGTLTDWLGTASGGFGDNAANAFNSISADWRVAGVGDFNGDHRDDILWRNMDGRITDWLGTASGGFIDNVANAYNGVALEWQVAAVGDFNGDNRDDILWRGVDGRITDWLGTASGGFAPNSASFYDSVGTDWQIAAVGDFDGDGHDDILWRNADGHITDWLGTGVGGFIDNRNQAYEAVALEWQISGVGDFDGDGHDDILWRNADGRITDWRGTSNGGFVPNSDHFYDSVGTDWRVADIGDYSGDGRDDILWRNVDGRMTNWLGAAGGSFTDNLPNAYQAVDTHWHIQPDMALV